MPPLQFFTALILGSVFTGIIVCKLIDHHKTWLGISLVLVMGVAGITGAYFAREGYDKTRPVQLSNEVKNLKLKHLTKKQENKYVAHT